ncbi:E3 SUMO-protein ligase ZBED1-like [Neodiprion lecontei]|uniref:E3 SUMO-protein ligase ZBED1-like n=1 Tax=Neodiprion lecontei TaxID=441921 RepID=A0ABM3FQB0_NEOLC|nr:E3 SUMO-protein ligase ZBED1-like [Neodiprion lecontei]
MSFTGKTPKSCWRKYFVINKDNATAQCKYCPKALKTCSNTTNLKQHMERKHSAVLEVDENSCAVAIQDINNCDNINPLAQTSKTTLSTGSEALFSTPKRAKLSIGAAFSRVSAYAPNGDKSKQITQTIAEMITRDSLPYSMVEGIGFKKLMKTVAPLYNVPCRKTITELIDTKYEEKKTIIKQKLKSIKNICLTIDEWKDMQLRSFLGVTVHFIENYEMQSMSIACEPLHENHTGEYLSEMILKVCGDWDLSIEKIVSVTTDNGSNIVKAVEISFGRAKHIRCVAHTLNLVVDNSVKSTEVKLFLDKVRKIVTWFHQSGVGAEELRQLQTQEKIPDGKVKHLVGDVSTRWNSQLLMIERFILMSSTIGSILLKHPNAPQMLQANEIVVLKEIEKVLRPFHDVTEKMSAEKYVTASKAIPMIKCLRILLDATTIDSDLANQLKYSLQTELIKRFENIQKVHLFSVATFLDPRFKKIYLDEPLSLSKTIDYTNRYLSLNMRNDDVLAVTHSESSVSSEVTVNGQDIWKVHHEKIVSANTSTTKNTELDLYIAAPLSNLERHMERKHSGIISSSENKEDHAAKSGNNWQEKSIAATSTYEYTEDSMIMIPTTSASQIEDPVGPSSPKRHKMGIEASFSKILEFGSGGSKNKQIRDAIAQLIYRDNLSFSVVEGEVWKID